MGGESHSDFKIDSTEGVGSWVGEVKIVPFLKSPGFCTVRSDNSVTSFPDVSGTSDLVMMVRNTGDLTRFSLQLESKGGRTIFKQGTYSGEVTVPADKKWREVSASWSDFALTWRGQPLKGPPLTEQLDQITELGLSTFFPGTAGNFSLDIKYVEARR